MSDSVDLALEVRGPVVVEGGTDMGLGMGWILRGRAIGEEGAEGAGGTMIGEGAAAGTAAGGVGVRA